MPLPAQLTCAMKSPEELFSKTPDLWHPLPPSEEKPLQPLCRIELVPDNQYPPPRSKWPAIPVRHDLGIESPNDAELIKWALSQAAKTVKRRSITPAPTCGRTQAEREHFQHIHTISAVRAQEAFKAELVAQAKEFLRAFVTLRKGGRL